MYAILMSLIGAVCWGLAPIFGKMGLRNVHPMDGLAARTGVTLAFLLIWVLATGGFRRLSAIPQNDWFYLSVEAFFATLAGDLAYYSALKWGSAGVTAVALSASPVITVWATSLFMNESYSTPQLFGVMLVVVGVLLVARG